MGTKRFLRNSGMVAFAIAERKTQTARLTNQNSE
jgi:hypothetical protein